MSHRFHFQDPDTGPLAPLFKDIAPELLDAAGAASQVDALEKADRRLNCSGFRDRQRAQAATAHYIDEVICEHTDLDRYHQLAYSLRTCRRAGAFGILDDRLVVLWKQKCGEARLCPHEARVEQERLIERNVPAIKAALARGLKPYKLTISPENIPRGRLAWGQRQIWNRWRAFRRARRSKKHYFGEVAGDLITMESPMSRHGDWNVHLNVFLLVDPNLCPIAADGKRKLDYKKYREWWGCQVEIDDWIAMKQKTKAKLRGRGLTGKHLDEEEILTHALEEIVKYPVKSIADGCLCPGDGGGGSFDVESRIYRDGSGRPAAPPLTAWPAEAFIEWDRACRTSRRTRSHGCLYRVGKAKEETPLEDFAKRFRRIGFVRWNGSRYLFSVAGVGDLSPSWVSSQARQRADGSTGPPGYDREGLIRKIQDSARSHWEQGVRFVANF